MDYLKTIKNLLVDEIICGIGLESGRPFALLKETSKTAKLKTVKIFDISADAILMDLKKYGPPEDLVTDFSGQRKRCDYILMTNHRGRHIMLFIEMKSNNFSMPAVEQQFKGAECLIDYCDAFLNRFHSQNDLIKNEFQKRFVVFCKAQVPKNGTRLKRPTRNDKPETAYKCRNPSGPSFKELLW